MISYDPQKTNLIINGTAITGFADGAMIEAEYNSDFIEPYVGTQGDVAVAEIADCTGTIKITLMQTSPSVAYLDALAKQKGDSAAFAVSIVDMNTNGTNVSGTKARVKKPANSKWDKEVTEREFEIFVADMEMN